MNKIKAFFNRFVGRPVVFVCDANADKYSGVRIIMRHTNTPGKTPCVSEMVDGEVVYNTHDDVFFKRIGDTITQYRS